MSPQATFAYQWLRDGKPIPSATGSNYTLQPVDKGVTVSCRVTATNGSGSASETTAAVTVASGNALFPVGIALGADNVMSDASDHGLAQYRRMKALGFSSVRIDAYYQNSLPVGNDATIRAAIAAGLDPLIILDGYDISTSISAFASFCGSVVSTYAPLGVHHYEILNEMNQFIFWDRSGHTVSPSRYARLLRAAYSAVKAADRSSTVVMGGLANVSASDGAYLGSGKYAGSCTQTTFMAEVYAAAGGRSTGYFDAVAVHPYTFPSVPTGSGDNFGNALSPNGTSVRTIMVANGDAAKKIWVTEFGAPTGSDAGQTNYVTRAAQTQAYSSALTMCAGYPWVGAFYCFNWNDDADGDFGLVDANDNAKPALTEVVAVIAAGRT